jgi:hypothetical protein
MLLFCFFFNFDYKACKPVTYHHGGGQRQACSQSLNYIGERITKPAVYLPVLMTAMVRSVVEILMAKQLKLI